MNNVVLETYEWDNIWWEQTGNETAKRILYIGDSISCGTRHLITNLSESRILCDGFGTSKALDNPYFKPSLELFMKQQSKCDVILFNNGLHGWHLSDDEYEKHYDEMLLFLLKTKKQIFILLTTDDIVHPNRTEIVKARNKIATLLAQKYPKTSRGASREASLFIVIDSTVYFVLPLRLIRTLLKLLKANQILVPNQN